MNQHSFDDELLAKREELISQGLNPYPYSFCRTHTLLEVRQRQAELMGQQVAVAGRLTAHRDAGKLVFADICDASGHLQLMFRKNDFDEAAWKIIKKTVDLSDYLGVRGQLFLTK